MTILGRFQGIACLLVLTAHREPINKVIAFTIRIWTWNKVSFWAVVDNAVCVVLCLRAQLVMPRSPTSVPSRPGSDGPRSPTTQPPCCDTGRPVLTDPATGHTICSCQYPAGLLANPAAYSRIPSLTADTVYGHYAASAAQSLAQLSGDPTALYPTMVSWFFLCGKKSHVLLGFYNFVPSPQKESHTILQESQIVATEERRNCSRMSCNQIGINTQQTTPLHIKTHGMHAMPPWFKAVCSFNVFWDANLTLSRRIRLRKKICWVNSSLNLTKSQNKFLLDTSSSSVICSYSLSTIANAEVYSLSLQIHLTSISVHSQDFSKVTAFNNLMSHPKLQLRGKDTSRMPFIKSWCAL